MSCRSFLMCILCMFGERALAYPQYAVRYGIQSCTACHFSPTGGGPRNLNGKLYGAHGFKINPSLQQDYVSADLRILDNYPQRTTSSKGGMGVMSGSVAAHVALDADQRIYAVIEHNVAGFSQAGWRDTYALFKLAHDQSKPHVFESLMVGRFRPAFGIVTDEHRTYTRLQTATEWYTFETGMMLSGAPSSLWHYDLAAVNGQDSAGQSLEAGQASHWGEYVNLRYMPGALWLGASQSYHDRTGGSSSREAYSLYSIVSLSRWTKNRVPVSLRLEFTQAKNWGDHLGQGFAADPSYVKSISTSPSRGWLAWLEYEISDQFTLIYKYDRLTPDVAFPADFYDRHGIGFRWVIGPEVIVQARTEFAQATHPSERLSTAEGGQNATFALLQLAL